MLAIYSVLITIVCGWLAYKNAELQDAVDFFSTRYNQFYDENKVLREAGLTQSIYMKTSQYEQDISNFTINEDES
jgi:hypothetical protein